MIIFLAVLSAIAYRLTGWGGEGRIALPWLPSWFFGRQTRLMGCSALRVGAVYLLGIKAPWYAHMAVFGLSVGSLSTYWDFIFGYDNFWFHGFMIGVATVPYAYFSPDVTWLAWGLQTISLSVFMGLWCKVFGWDVLEEGGRGASIPLSVYIL